MRLREIGQYLQDNGFGTRAVNIFEGDGPPSPDNMIMVFSTAGPGVTWIQDSVLPATELPRVQVRVRNVDYAAGEALIEKVYQSLCLIHNTVVSGVFYLRSVPVQTPFHLDRDTSQRHTFAVNFEFEKYLSPAE